MSGGDPWCAACERCHPRTFTFNGVRRGWHDQLGERFADVAAQAVGGERRARGRR